MRRALAHAGFLWIARAGGTAAAPRCWSDERRCLPARWQRETGDGLQ